MNQRRIVPGDIYGPPMINDPAREGAAAPVPRNAQRFAEALDAHIALIDERDKLLAQVDVLTKQVDRMKMNLEMLDLELSTAKRECDMHKKRHMALESVILAISDQLTSLMSREHITRVEGVIANLEGALKEGN